MVDERHAPAMPVLLTKNEIDILYDEIGDLCDTTLDGGSIPPQAWRTAANKLGNAQRDFAPAAHEE